MKLILYLLFVFFLTAQNLKMSDFIYNEKANVYFRKDVSKNVITRVYNQLFKNKKIGNKKGRLSTPPAVVGSVVKPNLSSFTPGTIAETVKFKLRIGKNGRPDIIIVSSYLTKAAQKEIVSALIKSKFTPGVHAQNGKSVRAWMEFSEYYGN